MRLVGHPTEWSGGSIIDLGLPPGSPTGLAEDVNDAGQVVGESESVIGGAPHATEWSGGSIVKLGSLPGSTGSVAVAINNAGQVVGVSTVGGVQVTTEWSDGSVIVWKACQVPRVAKPPALTTLGRWLAEASLVASTTPPSGPAAASSTWAPCRATRRAAPPASTTLGRLWAPATDLSRSPTLDLGDDAARLRWPRLCRLSPSERAARGIRKAEGRTPVKRGRLFHLQADGRMGGLELRFRPRGRPPAEAKNCEQSEATPNHPPEVVIATRPHSDK